MMFTRDASDYFPLYCSFILGFAPLHCYLRINQQISSNNTIYIKGSVNQFIYARSFLFKTICLYATFISIRTCISDNFKFSSIQENIFIQLIPLLFYLIVINRLVVDMKKFVYLFFCNLVFFAALNALFNIFYFMTFINNISDIFAVRLNFESIGNGTGYIATTYSLTYAIFCMAAIIIVGETRFLAIKLFYSYFSVILFVALVLTQGRGAILAFLISSLLYVAEKKSVLVTRYAMYTAILIISTFCFLIYYLHLAGRLSDDGYRIGLWLQSIHIASKNILFGFGETDFFVPIDGLPGSTLYHGHNILLNALLRGGIVGFLSMSIIIVMGLYKSYVYKKTYEECLPFYIFLILVISGIFDYDIVVRTKGWEWISFWLLLGLIAGTASKLEFNTITSNID